MTIALIGGYGQLGTALARRLGDRSTQLSHRECDLTEFDTVARKRLNQLAPTAIINCAAYNFVDRAETELLAAHALNTVAPGKLAEYCRQRNIPFVHVSTDYVFGRGNLPRDRPFQEQDTPLPDSTYGASKLLGEQRVMAAWNKHFILRTCGLYGRRESQGKGNFVETMLQLAEGKTELSVVDDQICTPTFAGDLASAIAALIQTDAYGLYHATNLGETTWCRLAREIFYLRGTQIVVHPITSEQFGATALRPPYSVLDCGKLARVIGTESPTWQDALRRYLNEL